MRDLYLATASYPLPDTNDLTGFIDIQEFTNIIGDGLDEVDFTFNLNIG